MLEVNLLFKIKFYEDALRIFLESWNKKEFDTALNQNTSILKYIELNFLKKVLRKFLYQKYLNSKL